MAVHDPGPPADPQIPGAPVHPGEPVGAGPGGSSGAPLHPGEPQDLDRDVDPERPYRARQLAPYRRDAGLYDSGLTGRYPGLRGSGARDPRIRSSGPGPGGDQNPERASMLAARTAIVATIVVGQLWALTVALNAWQEHRMGQVWLLLAFQALSFALAVAVWLAGPRDR
jgi:hypothetical protein